MSDDALSQIRRMVAGLPADEAKAVLDAVLAAGRGPLAPAPHTRPLPKVREAPRKPSLLTVRVDVDGTTPPVWRRLVLHGDLTLDRVHAILQAAFGWEDYHLHRFAPGSVKNVYRGPYFLTEFDLDEGEQGILESEVRLDQVVRKPGDRLRYTYDFGDDWHHTIKLESVAAMDPAAPPAACVGGRRAGPLEDCGGPWGHNELVEAFHDDPALSGLDDDRLDWVPESWDPTVLDLDEVALRLSLVGRSGEDLLAAFAESEHGVDFPAGLEALVEIAPPDVVVELARLCERARTEHQAEQTPEDLTLIARPFRYMVDLAGEDGIPLTGAGWMKPAYVERIYHDLGLDEQWIGKGNREEQTLPVAQLREMCQQLGLLRKHKGRLLQTRLARSLGSDEEYVAALAARLLHDREPFVRGALAIFALLTAVSGRAVSGHADVIADMMTACGLQTRPGGVHRWDVLEWVRPVWLTLRDATGRLSRHREEEHHPGDYRAVALARMALWPET